MTKRFMSFSRDVTEKKIVDGTEMFIIDNFFDDPDEVVAHLATRPSHLWKEEQQPSFNGKAFMDTRQTLMGIKVDNIQEFIFELIMQTPLAYGVANTNCFKMIDREFNTYKTHYWFPHEDNGYTALVYLTKHENDGTNLYKRICPDPVTTEHAAPWRPKERYELIHKIEARYNRMVIFDGGKSLHGMSIDDDTFFEDTRQNLVFFFSER